MKKLIIIGLLTLGLSTFSKAQITAVNIGYQESDVFSSVTVGGLFDHADVTLFLSSPDLGDDSNFIVGGRFGYMFHLYNDFSTAFYVGPHVGAYFLERTNFDNSGFDDTEWESSLNYGLTAGVYFTPINLAVSYGVDDLFETEYVEFKVGFNFMEIMGM